MLKQSINDTPLFDAWRQLSCPNRATWMRWLVLIGAMHRDVGGHLHPGHRWAENRWIIEREGGFQHPALGWRQHNRLFVTPQGLVCLRRMWTQTQEARA